MGFRINAKLKLCVVLQNSAKIHMFQNINGYKKISLAWSCINM